MAQYSRRQRVVDGRQRHRTLVVVIDRGGGLLPINPRTQNIHVFTVDAWFRS